jgi:hypothetical protein
MKGVNSEASGTVAMLMPDIWTKLLDLQEIERFPSVVTKFVHRDPTASAYDKTWERFSCGYSAAFEALARKCLEKNQDLTLLSSALFYLARHAVELALKSAILEFAETDDTPPKLTTHNLQALWEQLGEYMDRWGTGNKDQWGVHCGKLIAHMHESDPDGERFRYPSNLKGETFELTRLDLEELVRAEWHLTMYLDACCEMHADGFKGGHS